MKNMFCIGDQYCDIFYVIKFHIKYSLHILLFFLFCHLKVNYHQDVSQHHAFKIKMEKGHF